MYASACTCKRRNADHHECISTALKSELAGNRHKPTSRLQFPANGALTQPRRSIGLSELDAEGDVVGMSDSEELDEEAATTSCDSGGGQSRLEHYNTDGRCNSDKAPGSLSASAPPVLTAGVHEWRSGWAGQVATEGGEHCIYIGPTGLRVNI